MIYQERWGILFFKKLANGKYRYYEKFYDESDEKWKQASVTLTSKTRQAQGKAKRELDSKINSKLQKCLKNDKYIELTVSEVLLEYKKKRKLEIKDSTYSVQNSFMDNALSEILDEKIKSVSSGYFNKYFSLQKNSSSYKKIVKNTINLFFKYALKVGYIDINPIENVELPKSRLLLEDVEKRKAKFLSQSEMIDFIRISKLNKRQIRKSLLAEFMYLTGLRIGEALALMWGNVDVINKTIDIKHTIDYHSVSFKKFKVTSPKTLNSYRKISINDRCVEILRSMKKYNSSLINDRNKNFVFIDRNGFLICPELFNYYLKKWGEIANIEGKDFSSFSSHMLRHSHISLLAELEVPLKSIMDRVGHSDEKTTLQIYTHVTKRMLDSVSEKMETISLNY